MLSEAEENPNQYHPEPLPSFVQFPVSQDSKQIINFLLHLTEVNIYIAIQSVLDALDIWLSAIKYVFDALNPGSSNSSTAQMYAWLATIDGIIVFILGSIFFALFSFCGNYFDSKKKYDESSITYQFSKIADSIWPFVRDCFKGLKWTFKGTRSLLLVAQMLFNANLISYITPLGIGFGALAAMNRGWNRGMVERRKTLQSNNDSFREHVKFINAGFAEVDEKWMKNFSHLSEELKSLYLGSIIKVKREIQTESGSTKVKYEYFSAQSNQETHELKPLFNEISKAQLDEYKLNPKVYQGLSFLCQDQLYHFTQNTCYDDMTLPSRERYKFISTKEIQIIENIQVNSISSKIDFYHYNKQLDQFDIEENSQLRFILQMKQAYLENVTDKHSSRHTQFYNFPAFQPDSRQAFVSSLINGVLNSPYYFLGVLSLFLKEISLSFFPYAIVICSIFMILNVVAELYQEFDYQRRLAVSENKAKLSMIKRLVSYEWDRINQLIDNSLLLQNLNDAQAIKGKVLLEDNCITADTFKAIFMQIARELIRKGKLHQDCFPKKFDNLKEINITDTRQLDGKEYIFSAESQGELVSCIYRLSKYYEDFDAFKGELKNNMVLDKLSTLMQGIKNGLHIYGVFNGCMIAVSTMAFLSGGTLGIGFLYVSIGVGLTLVPLTTLLTVLMSKQPQDVKSIASEKIEMTASQMMPANNQGIDESIEQTNIPFWVPEKVLSTILDERDIRPTKNLMISEQCEVFRQFMSGMKKGVKFLQTILMIGLGIDDASTPFKFIYAGIGIIYGALFSLKGLRGLMRVDNHAYENSLLLGGFFAHKQMPAENSQLKTENPPLPHFNSLLDSNAVRRSSGVSTPTFT